MMSCLLWAAYNLKAGQAFQSICLTRPAAGEKELKLKRYFALTIHEKENSITQTNLFLRNGTPIVSACWEGHSHYHKPSHLPFPKETELFRTSATMMTKIVSTRVRADQTSWHSGRTSASWMKAVTDVDLNHAYDYLAPTHQKGELNRLSYNVCTCNLHGGLATCLG